MGKSYPNLLTCDFVCSGVQSQKHFLTFLDYISHGRKIVSINFKNKDRFGWERSEFTIKFDNKQKYQRLTYTVDSPYMKSFLFMGGCRDSCYNCRFASVPRRSDLTLGDLWGWYRSVPEWDDNYGISLVLVNSPFGFEIASKLKHYAYTKDIEIEEAIKENPNLIQSPTAPEKRMEYLQDLKNLAYAKVVRKWLRPRPWYRRALGLLRFKVKHIMRK